MHSISKQQLINAKKGDVIKNLTLQVLLQLIIMNNVDSNQTSDIKSSTFYPLLFLFENPTTMHSAVSHQPCTTQGLDSNVRTPILTHTHF